MIIFEDAVTPRFLARLDPRVRLAFVALFAVLICLCTAWPPLLAGGFAGVMVLLGSGLSLRQTARRLVPLNAFIVLLAVTMPLLVPGAAVLRIGPLQWSLEGFLHAARIAARANAVMLMLTAVIGAMDPPLLGFALDGLGVPAKFTHLLLFMVRYTEIIHHEYHHLRDAMRLRGFRPRTNRHTLRTLGYLIGRLLVRSVQRAERILAAMKCRGFNGRFHVLETHRLGGADLLFSLVALFFLSALLALEVQCARP